MFLKVICGAILTLMLTHGVIAVSQTQQSTSNKIDESLHVLPPYPMSQKLGPSFSQTPSQPQHTDLEPLVAQSEMSGPIKYSVWIVIALGPLMWVWLALHSRQKKK